MPFTKRQIDHILEPDLISAVQVPHNGLRLTESYLRRKLYAWEDRMVASQWRRFDLAYRSIREYAVSLAQRSGIDTLSRTLTTLQWRQAVEQFADTQLLRATQETAIEAFRASLTAWYAGYYGKAWQLDVTTRPDVSVRVPMPDKQHAHRGILLPDMREAVEPDPNLYSALGADWRQAFDNEYAEMRIKVRRTLNNGMTQEQSVLAALTAVRAAMGLKATPQDGFTANFYRMQTLTRTAIMDGAQDGAEALWLENSEPSQGSNSGLGDVVGLLLLSQVRWITMRDERVCVICRGLDGEVSSMFNPVRRRPPAHGNCRCSEIPVIAEALLLPPDTYPGQTLDEWLAGFGGGLILDDFLQGQLASTQI